MIVACKAAVPFHCTSWRSVVKERETPWGVHDIIEYKHYNITPSYVREDRGSFSLAKSSSATSALAAIGGGSCTLHAPRQLAASNLARSWRSSGCGKADDQVAEKLTQFWIEGGILAHALDV